jgi:hypothetical protein
MNVNGTFRIDLIKSDQIVANAANSDRPPKILKSCTVKLNPLSLYLNLVTA